MDGLEADGTPSPSASEHANAEALAFGVVPPARQTAVAAYVAPWAMQMGPMTAQALLDALHQGGQDQALVALLDDARQPGWADILAQGATFTWETWAPSDADGDSMSHGWGSTVLVALQQDLAGVEPDRAGRLGGGGARPPAGRPAVPAVGHRAHTARRGRGALAVRARRLGDPRPDRAPQHDRHRGVAGPTGPRVGAGTPPPDRRGMRSHSAFTSGPA